MAKRKKPEQLTTPGPQRGGEPPVSAPERERIARRAYELYLARGGADGREMDDWLRAEKELSNGAPPRDE